nr:MAG: RNA-dependent RNA polymerase [Riboviria sp.]
MACATLGAVRPGGVEGGSPVTDKPRFSGLVSNWTSALDPSGSNRTKRRTGHVLNEFQPRPGFEESSRRLDQFRYELRAVLPLANDTVLRRPDPLSGPASDIRPDPLDAREDLSLIADMPLDGYAREVESSRDTGTTQQVKQGQSLLPLNHSRKDRTTVDISLAKRIHVRQATLRQSPSIARRSKLLTNGFHKAFPALRAGYDHALFEESLRHQIGSWAHDRSIADLKRAVAESPMDWDPKFTKLFLKSQTVKKLEKLRGPAAPGQIVTTFPMVKTFRDAVWATYVERRVLPAARPGIYFHSHSSPAAMGAWYRRHWDTSLPVTSIDYTAWDSSLDEPFLRLNAHILEFVGVPSPYIEKFLDERLNTRSFLGPMPLMQFSGDRYTWLFNTLSNVSLAHAAFENASTTTLGVSGDDIILCGDIRQHRNFIPHEWKLAPKRVVGDTGVFCGFVFGEATFGVHPGTLLERARIGFEDGRSGSDFWDSVDLTARSCMRSETSDPYLATALHLAAMARERYSLPPPRIPFSL